MRTLSAGRTLTNREGHTWEGASSFYSLAMGPNGIPAILPGFTAGRFDMWGSKELLLAREPKINLSMFLAVGLGSENGVTIRVPTVMSETQITTYVEGLKSAFRQFYIDFLRDSTRTIRITTEEIAS